jgi:hypothetical protein
MTTLPNQELPARVRDSESGVAMIGNHEPVIKEKAAGSYSENPDRDREFAGFDAKREDGHPI